MSEYVGDPAPSPGTNRAAAPTRCTTCDGDRFVVVRLRSPETTLWMEEHGRKANPTEFHEEYAPCPDCHTIEISYWRHNRTRFTVMDPAQVREAIQ